MDKIRVLIVDDEIEFGEALAERLALRNFLPEIADSGSGGLEALEGGLHPDVILLDLKMPDMSGFDVLVEVKRKYPSIEVIMLTGHGAATGGIDSMERGAFDFIMKPVDLAELMEKIKLAYKKSISTS
ncbi:MAG: response regulator [Desulfobulbaceae bacterium]|nr:response regulator [Desulfobulbaceae bacterium]